MPLNLAVDSWTPGTSSRQIYKLKKVIIWMKDKILFLLKEFNNNQLLLGNALGLRSDYLNNYIAEKWQPSIENQKKIEDLLKYVDNNREKRTKIYASNKENFLNKNNLLLLYLLEKNKITRKELANHLSLKVKSMEKWLQAGNLRSFSSKKYQEIYSLFEEEEIKAATDMIDSFIRNKEDWRPSLPTILLVLKQYLNWNPQKCPAVIGFRPFNIFSEGFNYEKETILKYKNKEWWFNTILYSTDLKEHVCVDAVTLNPLNTIIEIKENSLKSPLSTNRWRSTYMRKVVEKLWITKRIFGFSTAILVVKEDLGAIKDYAGNLGVDIIGEKNYGNSLNRVGNLAFAQMSLLDQKSESYYWKRYKAKKDIHFSIKGNLREKHFEANKIRALRKGIYNQNWERAKNVEEIVSFYVSPKNGKDFEDKVANLLKSSGAEVFQNVAVLDKKAFLKTAKYPEVDIFFITNEKKGIVSCKKTMGKKSGNVRSEKVLESINTLYFLKEMLKVEKAILATEVKITDYSKAIAARRNILIWDRL